MADSNPSQPLASSSAQDHEMASIDQAAAAATDAPSTSRSHPADNLSPEEDLHDQEQDERPSIVEDESAEHSGEPSAAIEQAAAAGGPSRRRATARGFEASEGFAFVEQPERRGEDRLLDERVRDKYIREIGDLYDERRAS
ncbi:uncharacterized protein PFL1_05865 [Pseudozyma flocculosa PF-1]|uniref:Uncharacterized protein n=2 Tax=Pseudozyma flocculosa TaxID=84751 RepID=A0A5C3F3F8_9BASI|nr:uncharacterized protein PFL1_05865 [Pseudozyma flocculosa PF-1]EPQ26543.1 hypothetical protein PFL1_05865 [Pseudozyma flocculosa PF-1]SPO38466.1 uncharacterized protein PSFLO_03944 [Pseudozyma flocculosa]